MSVLDEPTSTESTQVRRSWKRILRQSQLLLDLAALSLAFVLSYLIRFEFDLPDIVNPMVGPQLVMVVTIQLLALRAAGVYAFIWRYVGIGELGAFVKAGALSALPILLLRVFLPDSLVTYRIPFSVQILTLLLGFGSVAGMRLLRRILYEQFERRAQPRATTLKPVLLIGAGRAGVLSAKEILSRGDLGLDIQGFVDDDPEKLHSVVHGVRVLGTTTDLPRLVADLHIDHVILTIAHAPRAEMRRIVNICESVPIRVRVIPGLFELLGGTVNVEVIRDIRIEDLLGRDEVHLEEPTVAAFTSGKVLAVTGAGGSIGSELSRQLARFSPKTLLLIERSEPSLFQIDRELRQKFPDVSIIPLVADVGNEARMTAVFAKYRPQVILHAAAHKHVPLMETNATEAIRNNVFGTETVARLSAKFGADVFVLISTDKAVNPTNIMGASKRTAELLVQSLQREFSGTRFVAVRFGNVIGSAGSVIPIFQEQIQRGGPITVTHPDMIRYFMTIPEASQLVLQAGAMGKGGEIFVLDMGEPVRILDVALDMIRLSGLRPYEDIQVEFSGIRPGEKLVEELHTQAETVTKTRHPKIYIGKIAVASPALVAQGLAQLRTHVDSGSDDGVRVALSDLIPEALLPGVPETAIPTEALPSPAHASP